MDAKKSITKKWTASLAKTETTIIKKLFLDADSAVSNLREHLVMFDKRLGPELMGYDSFKKWAIACMPWTARRCHQLLEEGQVEARITKVGPLHDEEIPSSHLLAVSTVPEDRQANTYQRAVDLANEGNEGETIVPKAKHIKAVVRQVKASLPVTDSRGTAVSNGESKEVWMGASGFDAVLGVLARLKTDLTVLATTPAGAMLPQEMTDIESARTKIYQLVRHCRPFAECIYCNATGTKGGKTCRACKGRRWLNEAMTKQAPKETHNDTATTEAVPA